MKELCVPAKLEQLNHVLAFVANELDGAGCKETVKTQVMVAVEEMHTPGRRAWRPSACRLQVCLQSCR